MKARRAAGLAGLSLLAGLVGWMAVPPDLPPAPSAVRVLDRDGLLIVERPAPERAAGLPLDEAPENVEQALLAAEDHRFYQHPGVDPYGIARALVADVQAGRVVQGASTVTQQLARTLWPRWPGLPGKAREALQAIRLELHLSKAQILAEYLNRVYYGNLATGLDAASQLYLDKPPTHLSDSEAALLVALLRRPTALDPWRAPDEALAARNRVLGRMEELGWRSAEQTALSQADPLGLRRGPPWSCAPHFVRRVIEEQGAPSDGELRTTLDLGLQRRVEELVADQIAHLTSRGASQAAVVVADWRTGEVLAYVGSADWDGPEGQVDGAMAPRSPGSALKPFLYWLGLERGASGGSGSPSADTMSLASILDDLPASWATTHGTWSPQNYDHRYHGPVTARYALARSLNIPAVRLLERIGVANLHRRLSDLGLSTLTERPDHYGLGLTLGSSEVRLDELVAAYAALAHDGQVRPLRSARDVPTAPLRAVGDGRAAWLVLDALDDPDARAASFGADSVLEADFPLSAKTGTSVGWRDNWAMGLSPEVAVGVWVGNFDNSPMVDVSGVTGAGPLLREIMEEAHRRHPALERARPDGLVKRRVCPLSGALAGEDCPGSRAEWFIDGTEPADRCDWHQTVALDETGALATGCPDASPRLVIRWPARYAAWAEETGQPRWPDVDRSCVQSSATGLADNSGAGIAWPPDGVAFYLDPRSPAEHQAIPLRAAAPAGAREATWRVDGAALATLGPPFTSRWVPTPGDHHLELEVDGARLGAVHVWVGGGAP